MAVTRQIIPGFGQVTPQAVKAARVAANPELGDDVVAMPLSQPDSQLIVLKDKSMEPRWVNYSVGDKESKMRFHEMKSMGYVVVKDTDVEKGADRFERIDGLIVNGDTVLMMCKKAAVQGAKKWNWEKARRRVGDIQQAVTEGRKEIDIVGAPRSQLDKVKVFVPGKDQLNSLLGTEKDVKK